MRNHEKHDTNTPENEKGATLDTDWKFATEAMRRKIISDPRVRETFSDLADAPVEEQLAAKAIGMVAGEDPFLNRVIESRSGLTDFLDQEPLPDDILQPDITTAYFNHQKSGGLEGITGDEHERIARKYRFARDIKLLSLMGTLHQDELPPPDSNEHEIIWRPTDTITVVISTSHEADGKTIMNPGLWEKREQIKDRVYRIWIDGKDYIMKEYKTARHTDVTEGGYTPGLSSRNEYETARFFSDKHSSSADSAISLRWEQPIGYVEMPDYQFAVFESEDDLTEGTPEDNKLQKALEKAILASKDAYRDEYDRICKKARELYNSNNDTLTLWGRPGLRISPGARKLTFREFSRIKARLLIEQAEDLLNTSIANEGYVNGDNDGFGFHIIQGEKPHLEMVAFDLERYRHDPELADQNKRRQQEVVANGTIASARALRMGGRRMTGAASLVMMEELGIKMPPNDP